MKNIDLTIMMPVFNGEKYIGESVESLLSQTYSDFRLIIIDDGSTDNTPEAISRWQDERLEVITNPLNMGVTYSRNLALSLAQSEYLAFFDADDVARPEKFERQIDFLKKNQDFGMVGTSVCLIDGAGNETGRWQLGGGPEKTKAFMLFHNCFVNSSVVFRRETAKGLVLPGGSDICEDYILWWWILRQSAGINLPEFLTCYRLHGESLMQRHEEQRKNCDRKVMRLIMNDAGVNATDEEIDLHLSLKKNIQHYKAGDYQMMNQWLIRMFDVLIRHSGISRRVGAQVILNRWLKTCYQRRKNLSAFVIGLLYIPFYMQWMIRTLWKNKRQTSH